MESKVTLSKSVMGMKFMKARNDSAKSGNKSAEDVANIQFVKSTSVISNTVSNTGISMHAVKTVTNEQDILYVEETIDTLSEFPGRRSFNNFNNSVNKYYLNKIEELNIDKKLTPSSSSSQKERKTLISDDDLIQKYDELIGLPRGPNQSRKKETSSNSNTSLNNNAHKSTKTPSSLEMQRLNNSKRNLNNSNQEKYPMKKVR